MKYKLKDGFVVRKIGEQIMAVPVGKQTSEIHGMIVLTESAELLWDSLKNGADEIDMVINIGWLKCKRYDDILNEIKEIKKACEGRILKVIIETCLLTEEEKIKMCNLVTEAGADFIKTSTGFSTGGATFDDIKLFSENIGDGVKMKAAGGISSLDDAEKFLSLGAERLGTSRIVSIAKSEQGSGY